MMLAKRIIPTLLMDGHRLVKGKQYKSWRSSGVIQTGVSVFAARGVDELIILDIKATLKRRRPDFALIRSLTENLFCPLTVGGGVKSIEDIELLLANGADKVAICTALFSKRGLMEAAAKRFGCQAIVAVIEYFGSGVTKKVTTYCGAGDTHATPLGAARYFAGHGAGEIVLSCIDRDGMMQGYDVDTLHEVSEAVSVPVIAMGGAGTYEHLAQAIRAGADGVAAGSMWQWGNQTPQEAAAYLQQAGIEVRNEWGAGNGQSTLGDLESAGSGTDQARP